MFLYKRRDFYLQRAHPAVVLFYLLALLTGAIANSNPLLLGLLLLPLVLLFIQAGAIREWIGALKYIAFMILVLMLVNSIINQMGGTVLFAGPRLPVLGTVMVSWENIVYTLVMGLRLLVVLTVFMLYNLAVNPDHSLFIFDRILPRTTLLLALAARMIPYLSVRLRNAAEIQQCRGVAYHKGNLVSRIRNRLPLCKVLLLSALEDSFNLGESIQGRAYGSGPRSNYSPQRMRTGDWILLVTAFISLGLLLFGLVSGLGQYRFYPFLGELYEGTGEFRFMLGVGVLFMVAPIMSWGWKRWTYLKLVI